MSPRPQALTLIDAVLPEQSRLWDVVLVVAVGSLTAVFARIAIYLPFIPVPITGQTLWVLFAGALLGSRRGGLAMLVYLAEGWLARRFSLVARAPGARRDWACR